MTILKLFLIFCSMSIGKLLAVESNFILGLSINNFPFTKVSDLKKYPLGLKGRYLNQVNISDICSHVSISVIYKDPIASLAFQYLR